MGLSEFTFRLILIFIPGIISFIIIDNLTTHRQTKVHHWIVYSLLLGILSYMPWYILAGLMTRMYNKIMPIQFITSITDPTANINFDEIIIASVCACFIGMIFVKIINSGIVFTLANYFHLSDKFAEIDAWDRFTKVFEPQWIRVRDIDNNLCYQGILHDTSDVNDRDGIILTDVSVFRDSNGKFLYSTAAAYIPKKMESLYIELARKSNQESPTEGIVNTNDYIKIHDIEHDCIIEGKVTVISIDEGTILSDAKIIDNKNNKVSTASKLYIPKELGEMYIEKINRR